MNERRDASRHNAAINLTVREHDTGVFLGHAADLSRSGLHLHGPVHIQPGARVVVHLDLAARSSGGNSHPVTAECCWCSSDSDVDSYHCGLRFLTSDSADQAMIDHYTASMPFDDLRSF